MFPARAVPVTAKVGGVLRHHHDVPDTGADLIGATGADVRLTSLKRVDLADLDWTHESIGLIVGVRLHRVQAHSFRVTAIDAVPARKPPSLPGRRASSPSR